MLSSSKHFLNDLKDALWKVNQKIVQEHTYVAVLGDGAGNLFSVDESGNVRQGYVRALVQMPAGVERADIISHKITPVEGLFVRVRHNLEGNLEVVESLPNTLQSFTGGYNVGSTPAHSDQHAYLGPDPLFLDSRQLEPLRARPQTSAEGAPSLTVYLNPYDPLAWEGGSIDLTSYIPSNSGEQRYVIIGLNSSDNSIEVVAQTSQFFGYANVYFIPPVFTASAIKSFVSANFGSAIYPSAAIRLYNGQTHLDLLDFFLDLRLWFTEPVPDLLSRAIVNSYGGFIRRLDGSFMLQVE